MGRPLRASRSLPHRNQIGTDGAAPGSMAAPYDPEFRMEFLEETLNNRIKTEMNHGAHGVKPVEEMRFKKPHKAEGRPTPKRIPKQALKNL